MKTPFNKSAAVARINAGMSQETASELLHVSVRTLSNYENGITAVPDQTVYRMMKIYKAQDLGWNYLINTSRIARDLIPDINFCGVASGALGLEISTDEFLAIRKDFNRICRDDVITADEQTLYAECCKKIKALIGNSISALIANKRAADAGTSNGSRTKQIVYK